jgi:hypothetical protein
MVSLSVMARAQRDGVGRGISATKRERYDVMRLQIYCPLRRFEAR